MVSLVSANLASISFAGFLYGVFFVLFCSSTYLMVLRHHRLVVGSGAAFSVYRSPLFLGGVGLFLTVTANWIVIVYRSFMAFVHYEHGTMPAEYFGFIPTSEVVKTACWLAALLISDAVIIYRLWIIWNRNRYVIVLPISTFLGCIACCMAVVYQMARSLLNHSIFDIGPIEAWIKGDWVLTMCTNLWCCVLISWRLWRMNRRIIHLVQSSKGRSLSRILAIFIESAALYVGWTILYLIMKGRGGLLFLVEDAWAPIAGIAFMLINIRVGMGYAMHARSLTLPSERPDGNSFTNVPVTINVTHVVDCDVVEDASRFTDKIALVPVRTATTADSDAASSVLV